MSYFIQKTWPSGQGQPHRDLTEQISNMIVVYSAKPHRRSRQKTGGVSYHVRRVPDKAIFGTTRIWSGTTALDMATVHRTVIDVLDAPEMGGGGRQALDMVRAYCHGPTRTPRLYSILRRGSAAAPPFKRLGFTAERFANPGDAWLARCRDRLSAGIALLDPSGPRRGRIVSSWRIRVNIPLDGES